MEQSVLHIYLDYTLKLLKSVILDETPSQVPKQLDLDRLFDFCCSHRIENMVYVALKKLGIQNDAVKKFEERYMHGVFVDLNQQYYLNELEEVFTEQNIKFMPMKGSVLKYVYPSAELRQSGDLDIFFYNEDSAAIRNIMTKLGFETKEYNESAMHDKYVINDMVVIEMHRALITEHYKEWYGLCQEIEKSISVENGCKMALSDEYYYMYMIIHMAKHMKYGGIGIRFILDIWVYLRKYNDSLDWDLINEKLADAGLLEFEQLTQKLSRIWFEAEEYDDVTAELSEYIAANGIFGTNEHYRTSEYAMNYGDKKITAIDKLKRYVKSAFAPYSRMTGYYPILKKYKILLPFCWIHRIADICINRREKFKQIYNYYDNVEEDNVKKMIEFKRKIGL